MEVSRGLSPWDYVVVAGMLGTSLAIGAICAYRNRKKADMQELLLAGRNMGVVPVTMSLLASFISAIMILGTTAEVYMFGVVYFLLPLAMVIVMPVTAFVFIPVFYRLKVTSAYHYLEIRFQSKILRKACSATFMLQMLLYMAVVLYAPSIAINAIMGFNVWLSVIVCGVVCTAYTSLGGLKAVMWTDVFQIVMMVAGLLAVVVRGFTKAGPGAIWQTVGDSGRANLDTILTFSPYQRYDVFSIFIGGLFIWLPIYAVNQSQVQRAVACPNLRTAQIAFLANIPGMLILVSLGCTAGLVVLHHYHTCDPMLSGAIKSPDQLLPLYVMEELSQYPGIPGLFMSAIFSGSLSTISSGINSMATVSMEDFIVPYFPGIKEERKPLLAKLIAIFFGVLLIILTYVASLMGSLSKAALSLFGMVGGPLFGIFFLGMFFPIANGKGACAGLLIGLLQQFWIGFGAIVHAIPPNILPQSTLGCPNATLHMDQAAGVGGGNATELLDEPVYEGMKLYSMSYMWYGCVAFLVTTISGLLISCATGGTKFSNEVDELTLSPLVRKITGYNKVKVNAEGQMEEIKA